MYGKLKCKISICIYTSTYDERLPTWSHICFGNEHALIHTTEISNAN